MKVTGKIAAGAGAVRRKLHPVDLGTFLTRDIPPREMILAPILPSQGLMMLYAIRGVGKTYMALNMAYAIATGGTFLRWQAPAPRRVLYIDGEMPGIDMQTRLAELVTGLDAEPPSSAYFRLVTQDLHPDGIPDLSTEEGQEALAEHLDGVSVVVRPSLPGRHGCFPGLGRWEHSHRAGAASDGGPPCPIRPVLPGSSC